MTAREAETIMEFGTAVAIDALRRGERELAIMALSWANDDSVIDALYDADMRDGFEETNEDDQ